MSRLVFLLLLTSLSWTGGFVFPIQQKLISSCHRKAAILRSFPPFVPEQEALEIQETAAIALLRRLRRVDVTLRPEGQRVPSSYCYGSDGGSAELDEDEPVVVLLHGFDSSCLEFRRLLPQLEERGVKPCAMDILGWGFTDARELGDTSASAKRAHLHAFWQQHLKGRPLVLVGASLGGAIAIDFAAAYPGAVQKLVLIDAQGFIDGSGPMAGFPRPVARWGIKLLGSKPLRRLANDLSYYDKETFATEDAMLVGRLPVVCDGWEESNIDYMCTGGFTPSEKVPLVDCPTLVLWGSDDKILDRSLYAQRFVDEMPNASLIIVDKCGHVPHLERPIFTADEILKFLKS